MVDTEQTVDWRRLREFADVDLEQSFVLSWHVGAGALRVEVDLCLLPSHPFYERPRPNEERCIRPASIEFPDCSAFGRAGEVAAEAPAERAAGLGQGAIDSLNILNDGRYRFRGKFGEVYVRAGRPILRFATS